MLAHVFSLLMIRTRATGQVGNVNRIDIARGTCDFESVMVLCNLFLREEPDIFDFVALDSLSNLHSRLGTPALQSLFSSFFRFGRHGVC